MKNRKWNLSDMPDLSGKVVIITGGNSGLGYESAKALSQNSAEVIICARTNEKGELAKQNILNHNPNAKLKAMVLDLMDTSSIYKFVEDFKAEYDRLDILMNNAGIMMTPYKLNPDGYESQMTTNYLGHFLLTILLSDLLKSTPGSRVINVSSLAHSYGNIDFSDLFFKNRKKYRPAKAYGRSKLANLLFNLQLQKLFESKNFDTIAVAAHPGASHTNLGNHLVGKFLYRLLWPVVKIATQTPLKGAFSQLRAATDPEVKGGEFYGPKGIMQLSGAPGLVKAKKHAYDFETAEKLWNETLKISDINPKFELIN